MVASVLTWRDSDPAPELARAKPDRLGRLPGLPDALPSRVLKLRPCRCPKLEEYRFVIDGGAGTVGEVEEEGIGRFRDDDDDESCAGVGTSPGIESGRGR